MAISPYVQLLCSPRKSRPPSRQNKRPENIQGALRLLPIKRQIPHERSRSDDKQAIARGFSKRPFRFMVSLNEISVYYVLNATGKVAEISRLDVVMDGARKRPQPPRKERLNWKSYCNENRHALHGWCRSALGHHPHSG